MEENRMALDRVVRRRRRAAAAGIAVALVAFVVGAAAGGGGGSDAPDGASAAALPELPRGGRELLPDYRLVAFYGAPQDEALGALGVGEPSEATRKLERQAEPYARDGRPVLPVLELVVSIAAASPGDDGLYRIRQPRRVIDRYLEQARRTDSLLLLDIQPGQADFVDEVLRLRSYLRQPDVGLALDPEWHVGPGEVPGQVLGTVDAETINEISAELAEIVESERLPQKLFVIHQFDESMISGLSRLRARPELATVLNVDGFGDPPNKISKYRDLRPAQDSGLFSGLKLFYSEDVGLMSPADVLELKPEPDLIVYE